jgi:hypothetical protein
MSSELFIARPALLFWASPGFGYALTRPHFTSEYKTAPLHNTKHLFEPNDRSSPLKPHDGFSLYLRDGHYDVAKCSLASVWYQGAKFSASPN